MSQENPQATRDRGVGTLPNQSPGPGSERSGTGTQQEPGKGVRRTAGQSGGELVTSDGTTRIADVVVSKVAGRAAREIGGVHAMGAGMARTLGSVKERLPGMASSAMQGVAVQVGERQAAIDIDLVVDYGVSIPDLAGAVRDNVIDQVEHMCGLEVVEVNIAVDDIQLPGEEDEEQEQDQDAEKASSRVR